MDSTPITDILKAWQAGEEQAFEKLMPLVYGELKAIARQNLRHERRSDPALFLQSTELTHQALISIAAKGDQISWQDRDHFFKISARSIRRALIMLSRKRNALKRGPGQHRFSFEEEMSPILIQDPALLMGLDQCLTELEQRDPDAVKVIELRYFAGFSVGETAEIMSFSQPTVKRKWKFAKAWLYSCINRSDHVGE